MQTYKNGIQVNRYRKMKVYVEVEGYKEGDYIDGYIGRVSTKKRKTWIERELEK